MNYNYAIHAADGRVIDESHITNWSKAKAVQEASAILAKGIGAYALINAFDWQRGYRVIGRINAKKGATQCR